MKCTRCDTEYSNNTTHCLVCNFPIDDKVNSPKHYMMGKYEVIDMIENALTEEEFEGYLKGNQIKYIFREKHKNGTEDIKKSIWYAKKLVEVREDEAKTMDK